MSSNKCEYWDRRRGRISTDIGKWEGGVDVIIRHHSLFSELFMKKSYMQIVVLNATGRLISEQLATWLENNFMTMSYPDARIWCNQVGSFSGVMQSSPVAAVAAGCLAADSRAYGGSYTSERAMKYLQSALKRVEAGMSVAELVEQEPKKSGRPSIIGFARPVAKMDERIVPHQNMTQQLGFKPGRHMVLADTISQYLAEHYGMGINIGGYTAAFMADQGFSPEDVYHIKALCVSSGVMACYLDQKKQSKACFLPMRVDDVDYVGVAARQCSVNRKE